MACGNVGTMALKLPGDLGGLGPKAPVAAAKGLFGSDLARFWLETILLGEPRHFPKSLRISAFHKESESGVFGVETCRDNFLFSKTKV